MQSKTLLIMYMNYDIATLTDEAIALLKSLIAIPSTSRDEEKAADETKSA